MLTDRGKWMVAATVLLWLASRLFGVPELGMAAMAALALVVLAVAYTVLTSANLAAGRAVRPTRLFYDAEAHVTLRLRNVGRLPTAILQVEDRTPASLSEGARFVLAPLGPSGEVSLDYLVRGRQRGKYEIGPLAVRLRDPFGIAARGHTFGRTDELVVYPPVWRLPAGLPLGGIQGPGGSGRPRPLATGEELANVREYVRGDDLRKVHWRSTAHRGKLMIRQDESPRNPSALLVLDRRVGAHHGFGPGASFEVAVSATASVAYHLAERSYGTTLLTGPVISAPRPRPWQLVLEELATITPGRDADLAALWQQLGQGVAAAPVVAAVVAVPDPALLRLMVRGGRGASSRLALLIDTEQFASRRRSTVDVDATAAALRAADWRVTVVRPGDRLDERWQELVVQRKTAVTAGARP
ncbi:MAG: DUF58 domain-containing protein [Nitriliruptorales bacterium]|nr:DUF58 domain-containing protein [Nitriliruptorales bacterium]